MALKCGIIGLANTGKTTLFNCVANTKIHDQPGAQKSHIGQINVPDSRLDVLDRYKWVYIPKNHCILSHLYHHSLSR